MKRAIFFSSGIGDCLLTIPLARRLRCTSQTLVAILTSKVMTRSFLEKLDLFDTIIVLPLHHQKQKPDWNFFVTALRNFRRFDEVYCPRFSLATYNRKLSKYIAKRCIECPPLTDIGHPKVHDVIQNISLVNAGAELPLLSSVLINFPSATIARLIQGGLPAELRSIGSYVAVQISDVDGAYPHKSWPFENWLSWLRGVTAAFPSVSWVLVGGPREQAAIDRMVSKRIPRVYTSRTPSSLEDAAAILHGAHSFVGLDGGLMHLAACLNKPTFTLWGASNPKLYGYEQMDGQRHRVVSLNMPCAPCESWLNPNQSRVKCARECPDFSCIRTLSAETVLKEYLQFANHCGKKVFRSINSR